ncbi:hypothetical protein MJO29_013957 [Puccinia striiformis f. sp. tritici]|nr:hypothetical protein MJO29_013957 [Puccinia striiformis f. sp. tritici]
MACAAAAARHWDHLLQISCRIKISGEHSGTSSDFHIISHDHTFLFIKNCCCHTQRLSRVISLNFPEWRAATTGSSDDGLNEKYMGEIYEDGVIFFDLEEHVVGKEQAEQT